MTKQELLDAAAVAFDPNAHVMMWLAAALERSADPVAIVQAEIIRRRRFYGRMADLSTSSIHRERLSELDTLEGLLP